MARYRAAIGVVEHDSCQCDALRVEAAIDGAGFCRVLDVGTNPPILAEQRIEQRSMEHGIQWHDISARDLHPPLRLAAAASLRRRTRQAGPEDQRGSPWHGNAHPRIVEQRAQPWPEAHPECSPDHAEEVVRHQGWQLDSLHGCVQRNRDVTDANLGTTARRGIVVNNASRFLRLLGMDHACRWHSSGRT